MYDLISIYEHIFTHNPISFCLQEFSE